MMDEKLMSSSPLTADYHCWECGSSNYRAKEFPKGWLVQCAECRSWYFIGKVSHEKGYRRGLERMSSGAAE